MGFKVLNGLSDQEGLNLVSSITNLILEDKNNLHELASLSGIKKNSHYYNILEIFIKSMDEEDYPMSSYTPKRLSIALEKYRDNKSKKELIEELLSRFYYDSCITGRKIELEYPPLLQIEICSKCNYKCVFCYQTDKSFSDPKSPLIKKS